MADELVARFDAAGNLVGACRRSVMRRENLWHAASSIVVQGPDDRVYLHRRTLSKDVFPGLLDFAAGGVVLADEDPAVGARRELDEELGVHSAELVALGVVIRGETPHFDYVLPGVTGSRSRTSCGASTRSLGPSCPTASRSGCPCCAAGRQTLAGCELT